mgnify:CR=1 FL=1
MKYLPKLKNIAYANPRAPLVGLTFMVPVIVYLALFFIYPLVFNISLGFQDMDAISFVTGDSAFAGLSNYQSLFSSRTFRLAIRNTIIWTTFSLVFQFGIGFALALYFNREFPGEKVLRGLLLIPWFLPLIVTANAFKFFFSGQGIINGLLVTAGITGTPVNWLTDPNLAIWTLTFVNIWIGIPFNFILLQAGLKEIPAEMHEAAAVDGANWWQRLLFVTVPCLKPVMSTVLMLGIVYTIKHFDIVWITTQGGPANSTHLLSTLSYQLAFREYHFGLGSAVANLMVLIILILVSVFSLFARMRGDNV